MWSALWRQSHTLQADLLCACAGRLASIAIEDRQAQLILLEVCAHRLELCPEVLEDGPFASASPVSLKLQSPGLAPDHEQGCKGIDGSHALSWHPIGKHSQIQQRWPDAAEPGSCQ